MNIIKPQQTEREVVMVQTYREALIEQIASTVRSDGYIEPLPGLHLGRFSVPSEAIHGVLEPSFCVIAQGSKEILLGDTRYRYDPFHYLLATIELPSVGRILDASKDKPYFSLRLELPADLVGSVMIEADYVSSARHVEVRAVSVSQLDVNLLNAVARLVGLLDSPAEAQVLLPLITREIVYRLLIGDQGDRLRHLALLGGYTPNISRAIQRIRQEFDQPLHIEQLALELGMSVSGLHHHFKAVTALSPLQFQKQIRLQEARRLMLSEDLDVASAASRVGYNDASYFNREYKSIFGVPPLRDVQRLRETAKTFPGE